MRLCSSGSSGSVVLVVLDGQHVEGLDRCWVVVDNCCKAFADVLDNPSFLLKRRTSIPVGLICEHR